MNPYPISNLFPQADNKTDYAKSLGYDGRRPVYVLDGKVISHRSVDWFDFCAALRRKRYKIPDSFRVLVWSRSDLHGYHHSILLRESSYDAAIEKFNEYLKLPEHCKSFNSTKRVQIHGPNGLIHDLKH